MQFLLSALLSTATVFASPTPARSDRYTAGQGMAMNASQHGHRPFPDGNFTFPANWTMPANWTFPPNFTMPGNFSHHPHRNGSFPMSDFLAAINSTTGRADNSSFPGRHFDGPPAGNDTLPRISLHDAHGDSSTDPYAGGPGIDATDDGADAETNDPMGDATEDFITNDPMDRSVDGFSDDNDSNGEASEDMTNDSTDDATDDVTDEDAMDSSVA